MGTTSVKQARPQAARQRAAAPAKAAARSSSAKPKTAPKEPKAPRAPKVAKAAKQAPTASVWRDRPSLLPLLQLLWRERRISRAELARRNDLSRSTVSELIDVLIDHRLVRESGTGESRGGRRPILLDFNDDACLALASPCRAPWTHGAPTTSRRRCCRRGMAAASRPASRPATRCRSSSTTTPIWARWPRAGGAAAKTSASRASSRSPPVSALATSSADRSTEVLQASPARLAT